MNLNYNYWWFKNAFTPEQCKRIIKMGMQKNLVLGEVNRNKTEGIEDYSTEEKEALFETRDSHISWIDELWIYNILRKYIGHANKSAGWNFQWDYTETLQFTKYNVGQFYDWHPDQHHFVYPEDDTNVNMRGKYRKLSTTLLLNDPKEFEGGELEFHYNKKETKIADEMDSVGTLVVFPAFVYHRVREVTEGTRYSLVSWSIGEPFR
tara:strand:+ start:1480 stop:2100 length:621 start_codon:yes stop_codon:yes gene_type:complete